MSKPQECVGAEQLAGLLEELVASLHETREACAAAMRAIERSRDDAVLEEFLRELGRCGVSNGFGVRADAVLAKVRAK